MLPQNKFARRLCRVVFQKSQIEALNFFVMLSLVLHKVFGLIQRNDFLKSVNVPVFLKLVQVPLLHHHKKEDAFHGQGKADMMRVLGPRIHLGLLLKFSKPG